MTIRAKIYTAIVLIVIRAARALRGEPGRGHRARIDDERDNVRRRLIAVAFGAGLVIVLLLVTARDLIRRD